ncbi:MAG TPA: flavodoxin, partial [bacterium]|nr:flavodoxin [bacterium]HOL49660.1 flavodoxin [bacterium]
MVKVLVVYHSLGGNTKIAAEIVAEGCRRKGADVTLKTGTEATEKDLIECDGIAIGSPDYFSYMAGGLKDFFDR